MKRDIPYLLICLILALCAAGCSSVKSQSTARVRPTSDPKPTAEAISAPIEYEDAATLCSKLDTLKIIPYDPDRITGDPIYDGLAQEGRNAIPCLIAKITDATPMAYPLESPPKTDFTVGDAAVFILLKITGEEWQPETMFSPKYAKRWKSDGVYAYFGYVEEPANRARLQGWWKSWMKKNLKD